MISEKGVYDLEETKEEARRKEMKCFKEKYLKCERCGSRAVAHRTKTNMIQCLVCGFEWNLPKEGEI